MTKDNPTQTNNVPKMELEEAIKIVNAAIRKEEERYSKIANSTDDENPVLIEGCTSTNYYCQLVVDPKALARTLLDYEYPTWKILGADAPTDMWDDLGKIYGLATVSSIDI